MKNKAYFAVILAATIAGASGVFVKNVAIPATSIAFIRTTLPTILIGAYLLATGTQLFRGNYRLMLSGSVFNAIRMYFFFIAYIYTSMANAVIIAYTWPIFGTLLSILFLKEKVSKRNIGLLTLSFLGILIVFSNQSLTFENRDFIGMSAALVMAITYAASVVIFKKGRGDFSISETIFYQNLVGMFVFFPFILKNVPSPTVRDVSIISCYAILIGLIGYSLFFYGLKRLKASTSSMLSYIEIVSAFCFGIFLMGETPTWNVLLGGLLIIITTFLLRN
jgi:drug/metabolite transporter (DMT)-like permease